MGDIINRISNKLPAKIRILLTAIDEKEFSEPAFLRLEKYIEDYVNDIIKGAVIASEKQGVDKVSELHVNMANASLFSHSRKGIYDLAESMGGILVGVMFSGIYIVITASKDQPLSTPVVLLTIGSGMLGVILIAFGYRQ